MTDTLRQLLYLLIDAFIPPRFNEQASAMEQLRARVMVGILLATVLEMVIIVTVTFLFSSYDTDNKWLASGITLITTLGYTAGLISFRYHQSLLITGNFYALLAYIAVTVPVTFTGGFAESPCLSIFMIVPVFVFVMSGRRSGLAWACVMMTTYAGFYYADQLGIKFYQVMAPEMLPSTRAAIWILTLATVAMCLFVYDQITETLARQLHTERNRFEHQALHDPLTGVKNRLSFHRMLSAAIPAAIESNSKVAVLYIDLNGFKPINDCYGHEAGDLVLKTIANRLTAQLRTSDMVVRLGGDEFAVIMTGLSQCQQVTPHLEEIISSIGQPIHYLDHRLQVSASTGIAFAPDDSSDPEMLAHQADQAMYYAKQNQLTCSYYSHISDQRVLCNSA